MPLNHHLNHLLEEQLAIAPINMEALVLTRNVLFRKINQRLKEFHDRNHAEHQPWHKTCKELDLHRLQKEQQDQDSKEYKRQEQQIRQRYQNDLDLIACIQALNVTDRRGHPIFGHEVSNKATPLLRHRNLSAHLTQDFTRERTREFLKLLIELLAVFQEFPAEEEQLKELLNKLNSQEPGNLASSQQKAVKSATENSQIQKETPMPQQPAAKAANVQKRDTTFKQEHGAVNNLVKRQSPQAVARAVKGAHKLLAEDNPVQATNVLTLAKPLLNVSSAQDVVNYYETLGRIHRFKGEYKPALRAYRQALEVEGINDADREKIQNLIANYEKEQGTN